MSYILGYTPFIFSIVILVSSLLTYVVYAHDKTAATHGNWRVPEKTLHLLSLLFGWPGAMVAQEKLRHKTKKRGFRFVFWLTAFANMGLIYGLHTPYGVSVTNDAVVHAESLITNYVRNQNAHTVLKSLIALRH
ncbi:MAG: uncharacterized membrane protein YsdA (DUF1294 family) [Oceanicoccus sp.]